MRQYSWTVLFLVCLAGRIARADTIFQDGFSGTQLNPSLWTTNGGITVGRTQMASQVGVGSGAAQLAVNTYNPNDPGDTFQGTLFESVPSFQPTAGDATVSFTSQLQLQSLQPGLVYGMFFYDCGNTCVNFSDEIDIELATNFLQPGQPMEVELNWFVNGSPDTGDGGFVALPGNFDPLAVHDWTIDWSLNQIQFYVDNTLLESVTDTAEIPQSVLHIDEQAFAPNSNWTAAYSGALQPTASAGSNQDFNALLTSVTVSESPEPSTLILMLAAPVLYWRRRNRMVER